MKQSCDELLTLAIKLHLHDIAAASAFMSAFAWQIATLVDACDHRDLSMTQTRLCNECFQTLGCSPLLVWCASLHLGWGLFILLHHCHFFDPMTSSPHPLQSAFHLSAMFLNLSFLSQFIFLFVILFCTKQK